MDLPHYGQILTTKKTIASFIDDIERSVTHNAVCLLSTGIIDQDDHLKLYATCSGLYFLSRLVYRDKDGNIRKLDFEQYRKGLFDPHAETVEEVGSILKAYRGVHIRRGIKADPEKIFDMLKKLESIWCNSISRLSEQIYIPELAYELEYVFRKGRNLPFPEYHSKNRLFPDNYNDFEYATGIAGYFEDILGGMF